MSGGERGTFRYANPDAIHWGAGCVGERLDQELKALGAQRVFLVSTRSVATNPALIGRVDSVLGERLVGRYTTIGEHAPAQSVAEAIAAAREARPDALLSFGGGSPIDATKVVKFALATGLDVAAPDAAAKARGMRPAAEGLVPHLAIPTTLSVAELSGLAGFSTIEEREKVGLRGSELLPNVVFYDADLALHTPLKLWLSTGIRAVDHGVETLLAAGSHPFPDTMALEGLRRLKAALLATHADPADREARTEAQLGAWFTFTLPGPSAAGLSHTLGKRLGSRHGIPHGVTSCLVLPHAMRYLAPRTAPAQARIAAALGREVNGMSEAEAAAEAADAVADLIRRLDLPCHIADYGLTDDDLREAVRPLADQQHSEADLLGILRAAM